MGTGELSGKPDKMLGVTCDGLASRPGGIAIYTPIVVASCYGNQEELQLCGPLGSCADFTCQIKPVVPFTGVRALIKL